MADMQSCPRCGTELEDDNWCPQCEEEISDAEISKHEAMYGDLWHDVWKPALEGEDDLLANVTLVPVDEEEDRW